MAAVRHPTSTALLASLGGGSSVTGPRLSNSLWDVLDMYIFHFIAGILFIVGSIMLMDGYGTSISKPPTPFNDMFFALGAVAAAANLGFCISLVVAWIWRKGAVPSREDNDISWLHVVSIAAAAFGGVWGVIALIVTFGSSLTGVVADEVEVAGYFMTLLSTLYFVYLVVRYASGLANRGEPARAVVPPPTVASSLDALGYVRNAAAANPASFQPIFGGGSGAAAFGGIDLSGLQPSSMSTLPPTQAASHGVYMPQMAGGCPMMMMPQMMMPQQPQYCAPDPNAIHIT